MIRRMWHSLIRFLLMCSLALSPMTQAMVSSDQSVATMTNAMPMNCDYCAQAPVKKDCEKGRCSKDICTGFFSFTFLQPYSAVAISNLSLDAQYHLYEQAQYLSPLIVTLLRPPIVERVV